MGEADTEAVRAENEKAARLERRELLIDRAIKLGIVACFVSAALLA